MSIVICVKLLPEFSELRSEPLSMDCLQAQQHHHDVGLSLLCGRKKQKRRWILSLFRCMLVLQPQKSSTMVQCQTLPAGLIASLELAFGFA